MEARTILVVDDSVDNRVVYGGFLEFLGFEVVEAVNGDEGVRRARQFMPDLILMDVGMPVMDGIDATRVLKGDPRTSQIPLLILTAHDTPQVRGRAAEAGCDVYLVKPVPPGRILQEMERLLQLGGRGEFAAFG